MSKKRCFGQYLNFTHHSLLKAHLLLLGFFVLGVLALDLAKLLQLQLAFGPFGLVGKIVDVLATGALQFYVWFLL
jgi:hypothetical protein